MSSLRVDSMRRCTSLSSIHRDGDEDVGSGWCKDQRRSNVALAESVPSIGVAGQLNGSDGGDRDRDRDGRRRSLSSSKISSIMPGAAAAITRGGGGSIPQHYKIPAASSSKAIRALPSSLSSSSSSSSPSSQSPSTSSSPRLRSRGVCPPSQAGGVPSNFPSANTARNLKRHAHALAVVSDLTESCFALALAEDTITKVGQADQQSRQDDNSKVSKPDSGQDQEDRNEINPNSSSSSSSSSSLSRQQQQQTPSVASCFSASPQRQSVHQGTPYRARTPSPSCGSPHFGSQPVPQPPQLPRSSVIKSAISSHLSSLPLRYALSIENPSEVLVHMRLMNSVRSARLKAAIHIAPLVVGRGGMGSATHDSSSMSAAHLRKLPNRDEELPVRLITVCCYDAVGLLDFIARMLSTPTSTVLDADVMMSSDSVALDRFVVSYSGRLRLDKMQGMIEGYLRDGGKRREEMGGSQGMRATTSAHQQDGKEKSAYVVSAKKGSSEEIKKSMSYPVAASSSPATGQPPPPRTASPSDPVGSFAHHSLFRGVKSCGSISAKGEGNSTEKGRERHVKMLQRGGPGGGKLYESDVQLKATERNGGVDGDETFASETEAKSERSTGMFESRGVEIKKIDDAVCARSSPAAAATTTTTTTTKAGGLSAHVKPEASSVSIAVEGDGGEAIGEGGGSEQQQQQRQSVSSARAAATNSRTIPTSSSASSFLSGECSLSSSLCAAASSAPQSSHAPALPASSSSPSSSPSSCAIDAAAGPSIFRPSLFFDTTRSSKKVTDGSSVTSEDISKSVPLRRVLPDETSLSEEEEPLATKSSDPSKSTPHGFQPVSSVGDQGRIHVSKLSVTNVLSKRPFTIIYRGIWSRSKAPPRFAVESRDFPHSPPPPPSPPRRRSLGAAQAKQQAITSSLPGAGALADPRTGDEIVAIKVVSVRDSEPGGAVTMADVEELRREGEIASPFKHDNICRLLGFVGGSSFHCLVYEYCAGGSLQDVIADASIPYEYLGIALDIANGMAYLHSHDVIHRDLKSTNVLIDCNGRAKIADFGLSVRASSGQELTAETGTYRWMAPEVIRHESYSSNADVYSFAIVLWQLITREVPFKDLTPIQAAFAVAQEDRRPEIPNNTKPQLSRLISMCWHAEQQSRPSFYYIVQTLATFIRESFDPAGVSLRTVAIADSALLSVQGNSTVNVGPGVSLVRSDSCDDFFFSMEDDSDADRSSDSRDRASSNLNVSRGGYLRWR